MYNLSKIMTAAHQLRKAGLTMSAALRKAWAHYKLMQQMRLGVAEFKFQKKDGSIRTAKGTLDVQYDRKTDRPSPKHLQKYFDVEKGSWRSFRKSSLITD